MAVITRDPRTGKIKDDIPRRPYVNLMGQLIKYPMWCCREPDNDVMSAAEMETQADRVARASGMFPWDPNDPACVAKRNARRAVCLQELDKQRGEAHKREEAANRNESRMIELLGRMADKLAPEKGKRAE